MGNQIISSMDVVCIPRDEADEIAELMSDEIDRLNDDLGKPLPEWARRKINRLERYIRLLKVLA